MIRVQFLAEVVKRLFLFITTSTLSVGAYPASCPVGTRGSFPRVKAVEV
jgi:hypothetical protein